MKAVYQRVTRASVTVDGAVIGEIGHGVLLLVGVCDGDTEAEAALLAKKVAELRVFEDENGKMNLSCTQEEVDGKFMVVSQFTLYGDCTHGRRPDMFDAARPEKAEPLYEFFKKTLQEECQKLSCTNKNYVECGIFGADMQITFTNMGPVTFIIESDDLK